MSTRKPYSWNCRGREIALGGRSLVMGILNTTPDSFSDGGVYFDPGAAVAHALEMEAQGADLIDIGGESTRPGADPVSAEEEIRRTVPVIEGIRAQSNVVLSIDTMKAEVAAAALAAGADIINDVSGFEADPQMVHTAAETQAGVVLMHMQGTPCTMQHAPAYDDVVEEVGAYLAARAAWAEEQGVARERIVLDPGIGFGKTQEHNLELLRGLPKLAERGYPLLIGASRKRFIGAITGRTAPADRTAGSLGVAAWSVANGAHILRVHDVIDTCDVCRLLDTLANGDM
ncbi:MAG: dihydropteroate synthase [Pontiellaceae bacterium]|nr:dihydropteroate synthase [Pontiellaceae bacterium]